MTDTESLKSDLEHDAGALADALTACGYLNRRARSPKRRITKTVKGKPVGQQEFKDSIAAFIRGREHATPAEVAEALDSDKGLVASTMNNMRNSGWLERGERGVYSLAEAYDKRRSRTLEESIVQTVRSLGGLARAREVLDDFDARPAAHSGEPHGGRTRTSSRRIYSTLAESPKIVRYDGVMGPQHRPQPMWGLRWNELLTLPLTGRNAEFLMTLDFLEASGRGERRGPAAERELRLDIEAHFDRVGLAFLKARDQRGLDLYEAARLPAIADALESIKQCYWHIYNQAMDAVRHDAEREAAAQGRGSQSVEDQQYFERLRKAGAENVLAYILDKFENGDPVVHRAAPASLYRAYESEFGVCAASLSRGVVVRIRKAAA